MRYRNPLADVASMVDSLRSPFADVVEVLNSLRSPIADLRELHASIGASTRLAAGQAAMAKVARDQAALARVAAPAIQAVKAAKIAAAANIIPRSTLDDGPRRFAMMTPALRALFALRAERAEEREEAVTDAPAEVRRARPAQVTCSHCGMPVVRRGMFRPARRRVRRLPRDVN